MDGALPFTQRPLASASRPSLEGGKALWRTDGPSMPPPLPAYARHPARPHRACVKSPKTAWSGQTQVQRTQQGCEASGVARPRSSTAWGWLGMSTYSPAGQHRGAVEHSGSRRPEIRPKMTLRKQCRGLVADFPEFSHQCRQVKSFLAGGLPAKRSPRIPPEAQV